MELASLSTRLVKLKKYRRRARTSYKALLSSQSSSQRSRFQGQLRWWSW